MTALTIQAALALAIQCAPNADHQQLVAIAQHESGLDPTRTHTNASDGSIDYGLMQINSGNFRWLGLTPTTALDPCVSIRAGATVLQAYSAYNTGSPFRGISNGYAAKVVSAVEAVRSASSITAPTVAPQQPHQTIHLHDQIASFSR